MYPLTADSSVEIPGPSPSWKLNVLKTFFANVFTRRVVQLVQSPGSLLLGKEKIEQEQFQKLFNHINESENKTIGYVEGRSFLKKVTGLVTLHDGDIILLRNPVYNEEQQLVASMSSDSLCFVDKQGDPLHFWQNSVEVVKEKPYCYC